MIRKILTSSLIALVAVGGFFMNVEKQENQITQTVSYELSSVTQVHAAEATKTTEGDTKTKEMLNNVVAGLNIILGVITVIVSPAVMLAGWLMSPDWTSGDLFGLREVMHSLWVTISNILYFVYAVLLIVIALATMFNQEKFGYRVMLPKLALGIILVPFTWWFVQWTVSLASVVTASVISIPHDTLAQKSGGGGWWEKASIPTKINIEDANNEGAAKATENSVKACGSQGAGGVNNCISPKAFLTDSAGMYGYLITYAYGVFRLGEIKEINTGTDVVKGIGQIIHQGFVAVIMFVVFGILVIALVFMLMMRAIKLWMYAIFSPLFTLHFVVGKDILGDKLDDFSLKEFIGLAFVPAVVGLTLSFGLVIVSAIQSDPKNTTTPCTVQLLEGAGCDIVGVMGNPKNKITRKIQPAAISDKDGNLYKVTENIVTFGGITFTFKGRITGSDFDALGTAVSSDAASASSVTSAISSTGGIFGTIVVDLIALIFIWASFMAAKNVSKAVNAAVQPFEDMGKKIGALGMSLPKYAPILPPSMGGSVAGAGKMVDIASQIPDYKLRENLDKNETYKTLKQMAGQTTSAGDTAKLQNALQNKKFDQIQDAIKTWKAEDSKTFVEAIQKNPEGLKTAVEGNNNFQKAQKDAINDILTKIEKGENTAPLDNLRLMALTKGMNPSGNESVFNDAESLRKWINNNTETVGSSSSGTTSNTFNIKTDGTGKFSLKDGDFDISGVSKDEMLKRLEGSLQQLSKIGNENIKSELKELGVDEKKINELIEKVEKVRQENKKT